ncbi:MAG: T9SS type A sorting domain-containing protein [Ignavibacteria bacterium]|nr:MAG: T9SS type A sorting domain-containing protein [Ignavibacteria bacterium]
MTDTTIPSFAVWGNNLFAGTHNDGVFLSTDNGTSWTATGLTNDGVYSLAVLDTNLFAGTGERGVWRRSLFDMPEGSIGGRVFHDLNGNGVMESGESGLTGWTLFLTGTTQETTQTDANGDYHFKSLVRGTYTVRENLPADWVQTYPSGNNGYTTPLPFSANTSGINFGNYTPHSVSVSKAWNMISLPVTVANGFKNSLFHHATSGAFAFTSFGYTAQDTLRNGVGYWLNFPENEVVAMVGNDRSTDTFIVAAGWNMVGSTTRPVAASSITSDPPGLLTSHFFGYRGGYNSSDSLMPGEGYWVKSQDAGVLILSSSVTAPANRIRIVLDPELPPPPPGEANSKKPRMPSEFFLSQNFPNPFNPSARIEYTLPRAANVSLKVFNMLGQEVSRLVYEYQDAGYKSVIFDASSLPSGVYLYRLQAGSFADVRKMLFLR